MEWWGQIKKNREVCFNAFHFLTLFSNVCTIKIILIAIVSTGLSVKFSITTHTERHTYTCTHAHKERGERYQERIKFLLLLNFFL